MSYKQYFLKAKILAKEAAVDLLNGCYNKATSSMWFTVEMIFRAILIFCKKPVPAKSGQLINAIIKLLKDVSTVDVSYILQASTLYTLRINSDHRKIILTKNEAMKAVTIVKGIISLLIAFLRGSLENESLRILYDVLNFFQRF